MLGQFAGNLLRQRRTRIVKGAQQAFNFEFRVKVCTYFLERRHQIGETFQRVIFALHRDHHCIGRRHAVDRQHVQRRGAIHQDEVVLIQHRGQGVTQAEFTTIHPDQVDFGTGKLTVGRQDVEAKIGFQARTIQRRTTNQDLIDRRQSFPLDDAAARRPVALRIEVDHQHPLSKQRQTGGQINRRRRFPDPALLIGYRQYFCQIEFLV